MGTITGAILAGGLGTRLRPVLPSVPKALAAVNGRPFITILLDQMEHAGVRQVVLCTGHLGDQIRQALGSRYRGVQLCYSQESEPLGTAGALRQALRHSTDDLWLVLNGDSHVATDLSGFIGWHRKQLCEGSLLLTWVHDSARFGAVNLTPEGRVKAFQEKRGGGVPGWINCGVYLLGRRLLETMPGSVPVSLEREVFPIWLKSGLGGYCVRAPFIDIGTPESLAGADAFFAGDLWREPISGAVEKKAPCPTQVF
jgi:NDP-sugar pyrophosphorylase family protein